MKNKISNNDLILKKLIKNSKLSLKKGRTYIYACVKDNMSECFNEFHQIDCKNLHPITSHIYNLNNNSVSVYCKEFKFIGYVDFVLKFKIYNSCMNYINIPIPNNLIYSCLNLDGKNKYNSIKEKYKKKGLYKINFLQLI